MKEKRASVKIINEWIADLEVAIWAAMKERIAEVAGGGVEVGDEREDSGRIILEGGDEKEHSGSNTSYRR